MDNAQGSNAENLQGFMQLFFAAQIVGLAAVLAVFYWSVSFENQGFGFSGTALFNWHPLFMTIGMVYLLGNGILVYRSFRNMHKNSLKWIHFMINGVGLLFVLLAAVAVLANHLESKTGNYYSLHSWCGILAVTLYLAQAIISFITFLFPGLQNTTRAWMLPYHVYIGHAVFILGIICAVSGLNEKAIWKLSTNYQNLGGEAVTLNLIGLLILAFAGIVTYISTNTSYKRYARPEDNELLPKLS